MTFIDAATIVARKEHVCDQCGRSIQRGEKYHRNVGTDGGTVTVFKECAQCGELSSDLYAIGIVGEDVDGSESYPYLAEVYWPEIVDLADPAWRKRHDGWLARWRRPDGSLVDYPRTGEVAS